MTDWDFVFDGVVGYLKSPMWNIPIITFMEKNCIVFEPNDENELTYTEIHKEYSSLVEELLSGYLKDVGITEEQFVHACEAGNNDSSTAANRSIFEQVWAGEDFKLFKKLMIKKNVDMELQALHIIQQRSGGVPAVFDSESTSKNKKPKTQHRIDEEKLLKEVMKQSQQEYEKEKERRKEIERMEKSLALSREESERLHELAERELNELERLVTLSLKDENEARKKTKHSAESKSKSSSQKTKGNAAQVTSKSVGKPSKETPKSGAIQTKQSAAKQKTEHSTKAETSRKAGITQKAESNEKLQPVASMSKIKPVKNTAKSQPVQVQSSAAISPASSPPASSPPASSSPASSTTPQNPTTKVDLTPGEARDNWLLSAKAESVVSASKNTTDSKTAENMCMEDVVMQRAMYMRMQREKIQLYKKEERAKRLQIFEEEQSVKRPVSSRLARRATQGTEAEKVTKTEAPDEKKLAMRRALAKKLKEVVNKNSDTSE